MNVSAVNVVTRWVVLAPFLLWGVWEIVLLALRARYGTAVMLVSQQARSIAARGLPTLAYAMTGLAAHFFVTWRRIPWSDGTATVLGVLWWCGLAAYALADLLDHDRTAWPVVVQYLRHPTGAALIGGIGAWLMFGQTSVWTPGR